MAKKAFLKDHNDIEILPITRGELVLDSSGNPAFSSNEFLATTSQPGLMSKEDKIKINSLSTYTLEISNLLSSGKKIATLDVGGTSYNILAPATYAWSEITDRPTKLSQFTDDVVVGKYLPLTGGTIESTSTSAPLIIKTDSNGWLMFRNTAGYLGEFGFSSNKIARCTDTNGTARILIHSGNVGDYTAGAANHLNSTEVSGEGSDNILDDIFTRKSGISVNIARNLGSGSLFVSRDTIVVNYSWGGRYGQQWAIEDTSHKILVRTKNADQTGAEWSDWKTIAFTDSSITGNAATATKLKDKVSLWGNEFDGTQDISGALYFNGINAIEGGENTLSIGWGFREKITDIYGGTIRFKPKNVIAMTITEDGNVLIKRQTNNLDAIIGTKGLVHIEGGSTKTALGSAPANGLTIGYDTIGGLAQWIHETNFSGNIQAMNLAGTATAYALNLNPLGGAVNVGEGGLNVAGTVSVAEKVRMSRSSINSKVAYVGAAGGANFIWGYSTNNYLCLGAGGTITMAAASMVVKSSSLYPGTTNAVSLGTSSYRWSNVYSVDGNFSGTITGNLDGTYVNKLTGYTKATAISALAATDTLNTALGKLEYKADVAYNLVKGAYDGDGTIENLEEILRVLDGIKDTETIQAIVGKYLPLTGGNMSGRISFPLDAGIYCNSSGLLAVATGTGWTGNSDSINTIIGTSSYNTIIRSAGSLMHYNHQAGSRYTILDSGNYNTYAPKLDGTGATGTWNINISGDAANSTKLGGIDSSGYLKHVYYGKSASSVDDFFTTLKGYTNVGLIGVWSNQWENVVSNKTLGWGYGLIYTQNEYKASSNGVNMGGLYIPQSGGSLYVLGSTGGSNTTEVTVKASLVLTENNIQNYLPKITNYYWANIPVSASSSDITTPKFGSVTSSGPITLTGTTADTSILKFSRSGSTTWNYILWPGNTSDDCKLAFGYSNTSSACYYYMNSTALYPASNNSKTLGTSTYRWSTIYGVSGNFSGLITSSGNTSEAGLNADGSQYRLFFGVGSGNVNRGIYDRTHEHWWIYRDSTTNTYITHGNVGIGSTNPTQKLTVNGDILLNNNIYFTDSAAARIKYGTHTSTALGSYPLPSLGSAGIGVFARPGKSTDEGGLIITEDTCMIFNSADAGWSFQVHNTDLSQKNFAGTDGAGEVSRVFGIVDSGSYAWSRGGFKKDGSSDSYVLLGGGSHKAISDFLLKSEIANQELNNNLTTITKSLTVTSDWMDTGIKYTDLDSGTYIVQVSVNAPDATGYMYSNIFSGVMSWSSANTNDNESDEIILHRAGVGYGKTIYLRTKMSTSSAGTNLRLQIAASQNIGAAYTYTFKFKRVI